jgi:hypothetical protein
LRQLLAEFTGLSGLTPNPEVALVKRSAVVLMDERLQSQDRSARASARRVRAGATAAAMPAGDQIARDRGGRGCRSPQAGTPVPAGRAAGVRAVRTQAGISVVQRQARLPVPPRYTSSARPEPGRPPNTYVREDQILPHLAAIAILLASRISELGRTNPGPGQVTGPDGTADLIDQLRVGGIVLTYHPDDRTLRASDQDAPVIISEEH